MIHASATPSRRGLLSVATLLASLLLTLLVADGSSHAATTDATANYRFVRPPIVVYSHHPGHRVAYQVYVRLNRAVPQLANHSPLAGADIDDWGPELPRQDNSEGSGWGFSRLGRHRAGCYTEGYVNILTPLPPSLAHPRRGERVHLEVYVQGVARPLVARVRLHPLRRGSTFRTQSFYGRQLGC